MLIKVFFLGRPGSGKSTAARYMVELARRRNYLADHEKDYDILYKMFQKDPDHKQFDPADYGGFDVRDKTVFDTALKQLEKNILAISHSESIRLLAIEFARDDYHTALKLFSPEFLRDSYLFFVDADLPSCIERIHKRVQNPAEPDHHFVSDYIMKTYYNKENWIYVSYLLKREYPFFKKVLPVKNTELLSDLFANTSDFAEMIFQQEFEQQQTEALKEQDYIIHG